MTSCNRLVNTSFTVCASLFATTPTSMIDCTTLLLESLAPRGSALMCLRLTHPRLPHCTDIRLLSVSFTAGNSTS